MICDICSTELPENNGFIYSVNEFRQILAKGFPMDEVSIQMGLDVGITREVAAKTLRQQFMTSQTDWFLCRRCAFKAESICGNFPKYVKNKWPPENFKMKIHNFPYELIHLNGILPTRIIDPSIGEEVVLYWMDRTDFVYELASLRPFQLFLKTGFFRSTNGPLMFLLFYIPNPWNTFEPFASVDFHIDLFNQDMLESLWDLAVQTHWHLVMLGALNQVIETFEFENNFDLASKLIIAEQIKEKTGFSDFMAVKQEFMDTYSLDDLYQQ